MSQDKPAITRHRFFKRGVLLSLVLLGLVLRLALLAALHSHPNYFDAAYVTDQWNQIARNIIAGNGYSWVPGGGVPTITRAPGYALFLAALIRLTHDNLLLIRVAYLVLDSILVGLVMRLSWKLVRDRTVAFVAGLFYAVYLLPAWHIAKLSPDAFFSCILLVAVMTFLEMLDARDTRAVVKWAVVSGVCLGAAILTRKVAMLLAPVWLIAFLFRPRPRAVKMRALVAYMLAAAVVVAPWLYRNARVAGQMAPVETLTWFNYWYGDFADRSLDTMNPKDFSDAAAAYIGALDGTGVYLPYALTPAADLERERRFRAMAMEQARKDPGHVVARFARNVPRFWYLTETNRMTQLTMWFGAVLASLFVYGSIVALRETTRSAGIIMLCASVVLVNALHALVFSIVRYMIPVVPYIAVFVGFALSDLRSRWSRRPEHAGAG
jgi:hypothetical protein